MLRAGIKLPEGAALKVLLAQPRQRAMALLSPFSAARPHYSQQPVICRDKTQVCGLLINADHFLPATAEIDAPRPWGPGRGNRNGR